MNRPKLDVSCIDDQKLAFVVLDTQALSRVRSIPGVKYVSRFRHWEVTVSDRTIEYVSSKFSEDELRISDDAKLVLRYVTLRTKQAERKARRRWQYLFHDEVPEVNFDFHTKPYRHQIVAFDALQGSEFFALFMEQGTGKTKCTLDDIRATSDKEFEAGRNKSFFSLVVCPVGLCYNWKKEMKIHFPDDFDYQAWILGLFPGAGDQLIEMARSKVRNKIVVCSMDRMRIDEINQMLSRFTWDYMVVDETARIKNPYSKRTKAIVQFADDNAMKRVALTGTPVVQSINDIWAQFEYLKPGCLGFSNFHAFAARYEKTVSVGEFKKGVGDRNLEELQKEISKYSLFVKKEDCLDLPLKIYETRDIEMSEKQEKLYTEMLTWLIASFSETKESDSTTEAKAMIAQMMKLRQIASGFIRNVDGEDVPIPGANNKSLQLKDDLEDMVDNKVIIWRSFIYDDKMIELALRDLGWDFIKIAGGQSIEERNENVNKFNNDDSVRACIAAPQSAGEGLDLLGSQTFRCDVSIFWDPDWSLGPRLQAEDRNHRIGQDRAVTYIDYVTLETIEVQMVEAVQAKKDLANRLSNISEIKDFLLNRENEEVAAS